MERTGEAAAREVVRCWEDGDADGYRRLAAPDLRYREAGGGTLAGPDAVVARWGPLRAAHPDLGGEVLDLRVQAGATLLAVVWRAVRSAPEAGGPPTFRRLVVGDVVVLRWEGARLVEEWHHPGLLGPLGLLGPAEPAVLVGDGLRGRSG